MEALFLGLLMARLAGVPSALLAGEEQQEGGASELDHQAKEGPRRVGKAIAWCLLHQFPWMSMKSSVFIHSEWDFYMHFHVFSSMLMVLFMAFDQEIHCFS